MRYVVDDVYLDGIAKRMKETFCNPITANCLPEARLYLNKRIENFKKYIHDVDLREETDESFLGKDW